MTYAIHERGRSLREGMLSPAGGAVVLTTLILAVLSMAPDATTEVC